MAWGVRREARCRAHGRAQQRAAASCHSPAPASDAPRALPRRGPRSLPPAAVARVAEVALPLPSEAVVRRPRLGGKYVSLAITVTVRAPEIITRVAGELQKDPRVKMAF